MEFPGNGLLNYRPGIPKLVQPSQVRPPQPSSDQFLSPLPNDPVQQGLSFQVYRLKTSRLHPVDQQAVKQFPGLFFIPRSVVSFGCVEVQFPHADPPKELVGPGQELGKGESPPGSFHEIGLPSQVLRSIGIHYYRIHKRFCGSHKPVGEQGGIKDHLGIECRKGTGKPQVQGVEIQALPMPLQRGFRTCGASGIIPHLQLYPGQQSQGRRLGGSGLGI